MLALFAALALAADPAADWQRQEAEHLHNIRQVTFDFVRAGEGYFSPDGKQIIYQAEEKGTGNPFYQIFVQDLATGSYRRVSPGVGKTTCSFFRPDGKKIIFASTHLDPEREGRIQPGVRSPGGGPEGRPTSPLHLGLRQAHGHLRGEPGRHGLKRLTDTDGYDAEG